MEWHRSGVCAAYDMACNEPSQLRLRPEYQHHVTHHGHALMPAHDIIILDHAYPGTELGSDDARAHSQNVTGHRTWCCGVVMYIHTHILQISASQMNTDSRDQVHTRGVRSIATVVQPEMNGVTYIRMNSRHDALRVITHFHTLRALSMTYICRGGNGTPAGTGGSGANGHGCVGHVTTPSTVTNAHAPTITPIALPTDTGTGAGAGAGGGGGAGDEHIADALLNHQRPINYPWHRTYPESRSIFATTPGADGSDPVRWRRWSLVLNMFINARFAPIPPSSFTPSFSSSSSSSSSSIMDEKKKSVGENDDDWIAPYQCRHYSSTNPSSCARYMNCSSPHIIIGVTIHRKLIATAVAAAASVPAVAIPPTNNASSSTGDDDASQQPQPLQQQPQQSWWRRILRS